MYFGALNSKRKFRFKGNKKGAKLGWQVLHDVGLGKFVEKKAQRGTDLQVKLSNLNPLEVRLASRVHCFMKVHVLKFGQRAVSGGCINFPVNVAEVCAKLPRTASDSGVIFVHSGGFPGKPDGRWYSVSREHVVNAMNWLLENNPPYSDVSVDDDCTGTVAEDSTHAHTNKPEVEMGAVHMDYSLPNVEVDDILVGKKQNHHEVIHLGRIVAEPINLFTHPTAEELAFPQLFPHGVNRSRAFREARITPLDYSQSRLLSADCRWRINVPYCFRACNMVEQLRLQDQISIALRMWSSKPHRKCVNESPLHSVRAGEVKHGISEIQSCLRAVLHSCITFVEWQLTGRGANLNCLQ